MTQPKRRFGAAQSVASRLALPLLALVWCACLLPACGGGGSPPPAEPVPANFVYFSTGPGSTINRMNVDGTDEVALLYGAGSPRDIALDEAGEQIYWVSSKPAGIRRCDTDGANPEVLVDGSTEPGHLGAWGIELDVGRGHLYVLAGAAQEIVRYNLDGTERTPVLDMSGSPNNVLMAMRIDAASGKMFFAWRENVAGAPFTIEQASLDGSNRGIVLVVDAGDNQVSVRALELDLRARELYWIQWNQSNTTGLGVGEFWRAGMDGSAPEVLGVDIGLWTTHVAVDAVDGRLYWGDRGELEPFVKRADLDGLHGEDFQLLRSSDTVKGIRLAR